MGSAHWRRWTCRPCRRGSPWSWCRCRGGSSRCSAPAWARRGRRSAWLPFHGWVASSYQLRQMRPRGSVGMDRPRLRGVQRARGAHEVVAESAPGGRRRLDGPGALWGVGQGNQRKQNVRATAATAGGRPRDPGRGSIKCTRSCVRVQVGEARVPGGRWSLFTSVDTTAEVRAHRAASEAAEGGEARHSRLALGEVDRRRHDGVVEHLDLARQGFGIVAEGGRVELVDHGDRVRDLDVDLLEGTWQQCQLWRLWPSQLSPVWPKNR